MCDPEKKTKRVMVTVRASTVEEARMIGRKIDGFALDESSNPIDLGDDKFLIFGDATDELILRQASFSGKVKDEPSN